MTTRESEWLDEDVAWAQAHEEELADKCPRCGQPLSESTAMANGEPVHSYVVDDPARCYSCDELIKKQEAHGKRGHIVRPEAQVWGSRRDC